MSTIRHAAVLGSGIMGSATALFLARRGVRVTMFEASERPFDGASRWNEGKIHLGYLYSASSSLQTAERLLPGGLLFKELTEELTGCALGRVATTQDDTYLVHRDSVTSADAMDRYVQAVTALAASQPDADRYFEPLSRARSRRLSPAEMDAEYDTAGVVAGFRVPERSVSTVWVADRFVEALRAEPRIELVLETRVHAVRRAGDGPDAGYLVDTRHGAVGPFDGVVNALWEGRLAIDARLGIRPDSAWSHRYRLSVFLRTADPVHVPNTVIATGPFGDVKNYTGRELYLSWYPAGLVAGGSGIEPPAVPPLDTTERSRIVGQVFQRLGEFVRSVRELPKGTDDARLEGGWVYAAGQGSLADPASTLHRRDRAGFVRLGSYVSVDTGKYSIAPWLARRVALALCGD
jgi:glycine/D-amino acid oxidase-like deaminating enzyme